MQKLYTVTLLVVCSFVCGTGDVAAQNWQNQPGQPNPQYRARYQGNLSYAPAGLTIPITLSTGISTQVAQVGDPIQASITQPVQLGGSGLIPAGSIVRGQITDAVAASRLGRSGHLGIKFTTIVTPDGCQYPINAHLVGGLDKYHPVGGDSDTVKGEDGWTKLKAAGLHTAIGAGTGAALGTAVGGIAGGGHGAGRGAWSGTAIGAGLGAAESLVVRKGREVTIKAGTAMQLQLDSPLSVAAGQMNMY